MSYTPLTREQKLMAEQVVQLGNIAEAIRAAAAGEDSSALQALYYSLQVMGDVQDKSDAYAALEEEDVQDYLDSLLNEELTCDCQE